MSSTPNDDRQVKAFDLLPSDLKAYYVEAVHQAPRIVEDESPYDWFVRSETMDDHNASHKLATYWKYRKELFGSRAFLPLLDLSGDGALEDADISFLRMGGVVLLPNDESGRNVLCFDDFRGQFNVEDVRLRCWFYLLVAACATQQNQSVNSDDHNKSNEIVMILIRENFQRIEYERFFVLLQEAFPLVVVNIHCCYLQSEQVSSEDLPMDYLATYLRQIFQSTDDNLVKVHMKDGADDLLSKLEAFGLRKTNLPTTLGGSWLYRNFQNDIDMQFGKKKKVKGGGLDNDINHNKAQIDERRMKKRKTDVIYARNRRYNEKHLEYTLKEQCRDLRERNGILREEQANLTQSLELAKNQVEKYIEAQRVRLLSSAERINVLGLPVLTSTRYNDFRSSLDRSLHHDISNNSNHINRLLEPIRTTALLEYLNNNNDQLPLVLSSITHTPSESHEDVAAKQILSRFRQQQRHRNEQNHEAILVQQLISQKQPPPPQQSNINQNMVQLHRLHNTIQQQQQRLSSSSTLSSVMNATTNNSNFPISVTPVLPIIRSSTTANLHYQSNQQQQHHQQPSLPSLPMPTDNETFLRLLTSSNNNKNKYDNRTTELRDLYSSDTTNNSSNNNNSTNRYNF